DDVERADQFVAAQQLGTEEVDVAGEGGEALVGGIAKAGRSQGQDLPPALAGAGQHVQPLVADGAEVANAVGPWQRGRMKQHARAACGPDRLGAHGNSPGVSRNRTYCNAPVVKRLPRTCRARRPSTRPLPPCAAGEAVRRLEEVALLSS